ncbi:xylulokinase [Actinokineospora sp. NBRC 105648]|uniref:xylulokinase n=1 Tax=Actinokineospora sp. NBRC 105648 TaxID=3032206 RepID=UPI0024A41523|nr:xylulokinase [Actinokineospora sp. NBRC 105648]GLZ43733.1 xylulokinase [Actinokineospora sp. NBRC 105648]
MTLVAGVDSSTQSCKVVVCDASSGVVVRSASAPHPPGTEVDPALWWTAFQSAVDAAGELADVAALSIGAQQHGMVCLDEDGAVVREALLWNDTRSASAAEDLVAELGGPAAWAAAVGTVPPASFTVTKLRWLAEHEPASAARTASVALPHDWLTWRLGGAFVTDRSDASGTGYFSPSGGYRLDLLSRALGHGAEVPVVAEPLAAVGESSGVVLGPGCGDNAAVALGVGAGPGDVVVSIGTSGTVFAVSETATADASGVVAGFADATGRYLPLVCTLNAAQVLTATCSLLGVSLADLDSLALSAPAGAGGVVFVPYLQGERTPNRPHATGRVYGLTLSTMSPAHLARAAVEGVLCGLADGLDALVDQGVLVSRVILVGGGARSAAVRAVAPQVFGRPVLVPAVAEYGAVGAARQAAGVVAGALPDWPSVAAEVVEADPLPAVRARYAEVRDLSSPLGP